MSRRRIGFWYRLAAMVAKPPLIVLFKRDWRGIENIPAEGGFLTAVNHNSYLDPLVYAHFQYNTGRVPRFLAKASLFSPAVVGAFMRGTGQIPVFRATADAAAAYRAAVEAVNKGECVAFYPEGTLTRDPELWPMVSKTGIARVALLTKAPVIPIAQWGANDVLPPYAKKPDLLPRKTHRVLAGPAVDLSAYYGKEPTSEVLREVTEKIMEAVKDLLAELRGEPAPAGLYDTRLGRHATASETGAGRRPAAGAKSDADPVAETGVETGAESGAGAETGADLPGQAGTETPAGETREGA
ncbi:lysophospholipid acyltransferase family protein [Actinacidiphila rubida]|uniref:1-acyl-sn-glycerol-3-phosphate acyltransferases n=1 Tax=Actinacidiphila rubida TaxID=310780 RepID=A0A1H8L4K7_9ACTN|nr:lysophospholipid acyltransferase family protein [Actinacidiphila rubida]SEO00130.1 1-acyl-sn-glycerol-3-phosphate acyltransferases [Actinacidiphila rubida]